MTARERMLRRDLQGRGITNPRVLEAFRTVPRHLFVQREFRPEAYDDHPLPIGHGQTISQPYIVAYMTELLDPQPTDTVLEIGTGSGYQAAILSTLCSRVYTIEIIPELGTAASQRLQRLGYKNVDVKIGDGYQGWPEKAPFQKIILTAAPPAIPDTLLDQLAPGGKMVVPAGPRYGGQTLWLVTKDRQGKITKKRTLPVAFVPMVHQDR
ncbi:MAG: protein-L-isoaspartate(D-aspartate) O-methyltransferase [Candidatus Neomarinimicrobiota bacterium]|nr:MAG: protein-L-isoaspartate(D-aspartate) O-methyltransferase [Candidatus Neomarinimicrobiota bacterium]